MDGGVPSRGDPHEAARRTLRAHRDGARCPECGADGSCRQRDWAARWMVALLRQRGVGLGVARVLRSIG